MEIFISFLWYMVWNCLPEFEPYFFWTFGDREQRCTHLHGPLPLAPSGSNPPRWTQQSYPLHTWKIRDIYCYFTNYPLCNVQNMKSKFIVMCRTSKNTQFIIKLINVYWSLIKEWVTFGLLVCLSDSVYLSLLPQPSRMN